MHPNENPLERSEYTNREITAFIAFEMFLCVGIGIIEGLYFYSYPLVIAILHIVGSLVFAYLGIKWEWNRKHQKRNDTKD